MMADLFKASKPKKTQAGSKISEVPTTIAQEDKSTGAERTPFVFTLNKPKGSETTINKK